MHDDDLFRVILILGFVTVIPVAAYHRLRAHLRTKEKLNRRAEGLFILLTLRPMALAGMAGLLVYLIDPDWMAWSAIRVPSWLRWLGVGLGIFAAALLIATFRTLGTNLTDTVVTRADHYLVTHGPYRFVRHPFYVATAMAVTANALVTANVYLALTGAAVVVLIAIRTRIEEDKLIERFGDAYTTYMKQTGRYFPRLTRH